MRRVGVAVTLLCLFSAACGSTVEVGQRAGAGQAQRPQGVASDGLGAPAPAITGPQDLAVGSTGPARGRTASGGGNAPGGSTPEGEAPQTQGETSPAQEQPPPAQEQPPPAEEDAPPAQEGPPQAQEAPLRVGVMYVEGVERMAAALGISGLATGDPEAQARAIIDHVNQHGGVAGRQIEAYYSPISAQDATDNPQRAQEAACQKLVQDDKVQFAVTYIYLLPTTMACFAKGPVAVLDDFSSLPDHLQQQYASIFAAPGDFAPGRMLGVLVASLWEREWLTSSSTIGVYTYDNPHNDRLIETMLKPALAAHGLEIAETSRVSPDGAGVAQSNSAVLKFQSAGVDRVIPVSASPLFLMQAASSQGYQPRYAMFSTYMPGAFMETTAPRDQLQGSAGIGWSPHVDIGAGDKPGPVSENETRCFEIMEATGQSSSAATTRALQLALCDVIFYLAYAGQRVGAAPPDLLERARPAVGASFEPANTFRSDVTNRPDGAAAYRALAFLDDCSCYQYVSPVTNTKD